MPTCAHRFPALVCLLTLLLLPATRGQGMEPVPGERQPPARPVAQAQSSGDCFTFNLRVESNNTDYFYTCCDRIGGATTKTDQDIKVPTFNYDCNPFRLNRTELTREAGFTCNEKEKAEKLCNRRWGWLSTDDCWVWSACFVEACGQESTLTELSCGDGRCDAHENTASCPLDCCPGENPDCIIKNSTCSKSCCGQSSCCASANEPITASSETFWLILGSVLAAVVCLLYCCCFCCCCCCRKMYNSMFGSSKKRRHSFIMGH
ncbi:uncharacterized protein LOC119722361 [Patiria miniata]|uniref:Uncharacterized protein n=1 Tax=Patiria miniata TaxID=46514 RepID=A0A913Z9Q3_PATMI|nr:uncharacterized protein LOC119722361 [Patiria miniata]